MTKGYKLTVREKVLMILLSIVVVVAGSAYFLVMPILSANNAAKEDVEGLRQMQLKVKRDTLLIPGIKRQKADLQGEIDILYAKFGQFVETETIEAEFTRFLRRNGIETHTVVLQPNSSLIELEELHAFTLYVTVEDDEIEKLLKLSDYTNDKYSYRLTNLRIEDGVDGRFASYVVEVLLLDRERLRTERWYWNE